MPIKDPIKRKEYHKKYLEKWNVENADKIKHQAFKRNLRRHYGITLDQMQTIFLDQMGKCSICDEDFTESNEMHVDHNHATGQVRGLLCQGCNKGIGHFKEDTSKLQKAVLYLTHWAVN